MMLLRGVFEGFRSLLLIVELIFLRLFCFVWGSFFRVFYLRLLVQTSATWLKPVCWYLLMLVLGRCLKPFLG